MHRSMCVVAAGWLLACAAVSSADDEPGTQRSARLAVQVPVELQYLLYLPKDYDAKESWPLLLFLHGSGERGDDLELVKVHGPPKLVAEGKDFPFIVVSPQCPKEQSWEAYQLRALLDDLESRYKVDPDRIYVTGLSMGGFGTWQLAATTPNRFAAIAPICGGGDVIWARRLENVPVWAFHGALDEGVPVERSQQMVNAVWRRGGEAKLTVYETLEHDSWTDTYNNPALYDWLLAHKRQPPKVEQETK